MSALAVSLRALAAPASVLSLVVLALNDHVLKQAWPGLVTGKLSDVAGLVFAPLLLAVLLAAVRVPRPMTVSVAATGAGFVLCKTSTVGAAVTSSVWSLFGTPTMIRADASDLVALPALYVAWRIHRAALADDGAGWRHTIALAVGMAVLPAGVLATSATSCSEPNGYAEVGVLEGDFEGPPRRTEKRLAAGTLLGARFTIDGQGALVESDFELAGFSLTRRTLTCAGNRCWRLVGDDVVEGSTDAGDTWVREGVLTAEDRREISDDVGTDDGCDGDPPAVGATDIAALRTERGPVVIAALQRGGVWQREATGTWTVLTEGELRRLVAEAPRPPLPTVTELDAPDPPDASDAPLGTGTATPGPACASPSERTVTPHPSNGPPTTYPVCP